MILSVLISLLFIFQEMEDISWKLYLLPKQVLMTVIVVLGRPGPPPPSIQIVSRCSISHSKILHLQGKTVFTFFLCVS